MPTKDVVPVLLSPMTKTLGFVDTMAVLGNAIANKIKGSAINGRAACIESMMKYFGFAVEGFCYW
jgi:hypothetical protein